MQEDQQNQSNILPNVAFAGMSTVALGIFIAVVGFLFSNPQSGDQSANVATGVIMIITGSVILYARRQFITQNKIGSSIKNDIGQVGQGAGCAFSIGVCAIAFYIVGYTLLWYAVSGRNVDALFLVTGIVLVVLGGIPSIREIINFYRAETHSPIGGEVSSTLDSDANLPD